jgi:nucleoid DNA-binding protein
MPKRDVARVLNGLATVIQKNLIAGREINLRKVGRFKRGFAAAGKRRSPDGTKLTRPFNVIYFKAARSLKERMKDDGFGGKRK